MYTEKLVVDSIEFALSEIREHGLPTYLHFYLSLSKARELAEAAQADANLAQIGAALMDIKLGQGFKSGRLAEHVSMGVEASKSFLSAYDLSQDEIDKIVNCIQAHHGAVPFSSIESAIVTSADCYRFMHPAGLLSYIGTLSKRGLSFHEVVDQAEAKLEEKRALLAFGPAEEELIPHYDSFKQMFAAARAVVEE